MIGEKKIEEAAKEYASSSLVDDEYPGEIQEGFKAGINWFLDNLWHPMSEPPKRGSEILIKVNMEIFREKGINRNSTFVHEYDYHDDWETYANDARFIEWLYVDDLLKGGKHE